MSLLNLFKRTEENIDIPDLGKFIIRKHEGTKAAFKKISNKMGDNFSLIFYLYKGYVVNNQIEFYKNFEANWEKFCEESQRIAQNQEPIKLKSIVIAHSNDNTHSYVCEVSTNLHVMEFEKGV